MTQPSFTQALDARIAKYDLLCHPYYQSWSMGTLSRENIASYAADYYHHVAAFTGYLDKLHSRLPDGQVRDLVWQNKEEEEGSRAADKRSHADLWLDFAEGMGASRQQVKSHQPLPEIKQLIERFDHIATKGSLAEALAALYAYESQIPRVAAEKERGLMNLYGADKQTAYYFTLHKSYDVLHSRIWLELLSQEIERNPDSRQPALATAEEAAKALWHALDGVENQRRSAVSQN